MSVDVVRGGRYRVIVAVEHRALPGRCAGGGTCSLTVAASMLASHCHSGCRHYRRDVHYTQCCRVCVPRERPSVSLSCVSDGGATWCASEPGPEVGTVLMRDVARWAVVR